MTSAVVIRPEATADHGAVYEIVKLAFGRDGEARLVEELRKIPDFDPALSLVACVEGVPVGHILFTPVSVFRDSEVQATGQALAPLAVHPHHQRQGIGEALVRAGLDACQLRGHELVIVVGHPEYYPRFGFRPARPFGLEAPFPVRDAAFMACDLSHQDLQLRKVVPGVVTYAAPFAQV